MRSLELHRTEISIDWSTLDEQDELQVVNAIRIDAWHENNFEQNF